MKRVILLVFLAVIAFATGNSAQLNLKTKTLNGDPGGGIGPRRSPVFVPIVNQEGHTIYLEQCNYQDIIIQILNGEEVVYSVIVPVGTNQIQLPESLQDDYEFDLICDNYCFYDNVTL